jgi:hypothetical protein
MGENQLKIRNIRFKRALDRGVETQLRECLLRKRHGAKLGSHERCIGQKKSLLLVARTKTIMFDEEDAIASLCKQGRGEGAPELPSDDNYVVNVP